MVQLVELFPDFKICATLMRKLTWSHFLIIFPIKNKIEREFYAELCRVEGWNIKTLRSKINSMLYERTALSKRPDELALGCKVLLDRDAAEYFQVELKTLSAAVKRQQNRFPPDCMLVFRGEEAADLERREAAKGSGKRQRVLGFTEVGIEMLAGVLKSKRAVEHSVETIRNGVAAFARIRSRRP